MKSILLTSIPKYDLSAPPAALGVLQGVAKSNGWQTKIFDFNLFLHKNLTDEERDADTILKINKLGVWSKGLQKGLTTLDKDFYDEEQTFRDNMVRAEKNIRRKNPDANDDNIDILLDDFVEQNQIDQEIDDEAYDMGFMGETYWDGNTDGNDAPEEEHSDYEEEY